MTNRSEALGGWPSAAHLYRAAMEGATYSLRFGYDAFVRAGMSFQRIVLTGGGAHSTAWRQMVADVFDLPVEVPQQPEAAAFGAALQALWSLRREQDAAVSLPALTQAHVAADASRTALPDPTRVAAYQAPYSRFLQHLDAMRPLYVA